MIAKHVDRGMNVVVFDVGGVLLSLDFLTVFKQISERSPLTADQIESLFWPERGPDGACDSTVLALATSGRISAKKALDTVYRKSEFQGSRDELTWIYHGLFTERIEDTIGLLIEAAGTTRVGILSNTNAWGWPGAETMLPELDLVDKIFLSFEVGLVKPDERLFAHVAEEFGVPPERVTFIDDTLDIVERARTFGIDAIHYSSPYDLRHQLSARGIVSPAASSLLAFA